ncbi:amidase [Apodospora peruviana]|uniref:Amidase n=1 Tax=Apodospora peruviana TaxID=516989 RepID=A0AAE0MH32_9PEZI|nr:amidase [Apodospora peruviana]
MRELVRKHDGAPPVPTRLQMQKLNGFDLYEVTVDELQDHFSQNHFSAAQYVKHCIDYIRVLNPYLEAVIEINPDACQIAEKLDEDRAAGKIRGPLHGIPILVKDNIATKDLMETTAGSWALLGSVVKDDAFVVKRLREAGAVILGHTNMSEWASLRSKTHSDGFSPRGGQARNPYDLTKSPFGSSSGSAIAICANMAPLAIGTETDTSIIRPAGINGIVGIKPTVGLTSRAGTIPISLNLDTVGSFGRTVADAAAMLDAIAAKDEQDGFTMVPERKQPESFAACVSGLEKLKGARFGLPMKGCFEPLAPPSAKVVVSKVLDAMRRAGAEIFEVDFPSIDERVGEDGSWNWEHGDPHRSEWTVVKVDAYNGINDYLQKWLVDSPVRSVEDIVEYNKQNNGTEGAEPGALPAYPDGQSNLHEIIDCHGVKDETYYQALNHIRKQTREKGIDAALSYKTPKTGETIALDGLLFCDRSGIGQQFAAQAGYPIICLPIGLDDDGMPVSLSLQHTAWKEAELVQWASAIEDLWNRENGWRALPSFRNLGAKNIPTEK